PRLSEPPPSGRPSRPPISVVPEDGKTVADHVREGDACVRGGAPEVALACYRKALGLLGSSGASGSEPASVYVSIAAVKRAQGKAREAISNFEKALQASPGYRPALEALLELNLAERDWRAVQATEEKLLGLTEGEDSQFAMLVTYGTRWLELARDPE